MEYNEFLTKLGNAAPKYVEIPLNSEDIAIDEAESAKGIHKDIDKTV